MVMYSSIFYRVTLMSHVQVLLVLWLNVSVTLAEGIYSGHVSINSESCHANITSKSSNGFMYECFCQVV